MIAALPHSRAARAWRGTAAAFFATLCAAASHSFAGGQLTWLSLVTTTIVALPVCVALTGRVGSLWRIATAVIFSQSLFHASFSSLGAPQMGVAVVPDQVSEHAHHQHGATFTPLVDADPLTGITSMWIAHAIAALLTIGLLTYGERAAIRLGRALRRTIFHMHTPARVFERLSLHPVPQHVEGPWQRFTGVNSITHRGPPRAAHPTIHPARNLTAERRAPHTRTRASSGRKISCATQLRRVSHPHPTIHTTRIRRREPLHGHACAPH